MLEFSFRDDASSRFPDNNRLAFFPSASAGWRITQEPFMSGLTWMDELKFRGSWGQLGNQSIGNYPYQNSLNISTAPGDETLDYNFGGTLTQGVSKRTTNNTNIKWETTTVTDLGIDFSFFHSNYSARLIGIKRKPRIFSGACRYLITWVWMRRT